MDPFDAVDYVRCPLYNPLWAPALTRRHLGGVQRMVKLCGSVFQISGALKTSFGTLDRRIIGI